MGERRPSTVNVDRDASAPNIRRLREMRLILVGVSASLLGDAALTTGLLWYALERTGSAAAMSGIPLVSSLVLLAMMPVAGRQAPGAYLRRQATRRQSGGG